MKSLSALRVMESLDTVCKYLAQASLFLMMVLTVGDAIGRKLNYPIAGAAEFSAEYLMVGVVFLALGTTQRAGRHIKVEVMERFIPQFADRWLKAATSAIAFIYFGIIAYYGWLQTAYALRIDQRSTSELAYPLAPAHFLVAIGSAILCMWLAKDVAEALVRRNERE